VAVEADLAPVVVRVIPVPLEPLDVVADRLQEDPHRRVGIAVVEDHLGGLRDHVLETGEVKVATRLVVEGRVAGELLEFIRRPMHVVVEPGKRDEVVGREVVRIRETLRCQLLNVHRRALVYAAVVRIVEIMTAEDDSIDARTTNAARRRAPDEGTRSRREYWTRVSNREGEHEGRPRASSPRNDPRGQRRRGFRPPSRRAMTW